MKEIIFTIILGIIQGLTEFLPVSSSGHLALFQDVFGITENNLFTTVALHFGTLLAVVVYYFKDILNLFKPQNRITIWYLFLSTLPAGVAMLFLNNTVNSMFSSIDFLWVGFLITAIILWITDYVGKRIKNPKTISYKTALIMGLSQAFAIFPGISRSGSTISGGIILANGERKHIAGFAFLMSIPIIAGSAIFEVSTIDFSHVNIAATLVGVVASFITGYFAIKFMLKLISRCNFKWFSVYLLLLVLITFINGVVIPLW